MSDIKKFVWAYIVERGHLTNGEWSYYGGDWEYPNKSHDYNNDGVKLREKIKTIGVDWDSTGDPVSSIESEFTDTFHESKSVETLLGTLVLKDGSKHMIGVGNANLEFSGYARLIKKQSEDTNRISRIFGE